MSRQFNRARPGSDRASLYDEITGTIVAELEAGRVPWVQPWGTAVANAPLAMPRNAAIGRQYSGINVLILWGAVIEHGFPGQGWLTFRQALSLGGHVRNGERGTTVVYADRFVPDDEKRRARETGADVHAIPFLKRFTVFNAAQCDGLPEYIATLAPPPPPGLIEPRVEALIRATGIDFRIGGAHAFYAPAFDYVQVPPPHAYFEPINWHRTARHELGHATGHASRVGRDLTGSFGTKAYAFEELVAEMNAAFCCASLGIVPTVRHADYLGAWLAVLREDNRAIVHAASEPEVIFDVVSKQRDLVMDEATPDFCPPSRSPQPTGQQGRRLAARLPARCRPRRRRGRRAEGGMMNAVFPSFAPTSDQSASIRLRVLSLGAGVQSTTLALMAAHGEIGPMPDCAIFADTGWEPQAVYEHLDWLRSANVLPFPVHIVSAGDLRADLLAGAQGERWASIPAFTRTVTPAGTELPVYDEDENGDPMIVGTRVLATERVGIGMIRRQCTGDYKIVPIRRKVRELLGIAGRRSPKVAVAEQWIGISLDEAIRMKPSFVNWQVNRWPLIERGMTRQDCLRWLTRNGYPLPPKSSCIGCPFHSDTVWRQMRNDDSVSWADAVAVDRAIRTGFRGIRANVYLHRSAVPLDEADLTTDADRGQLDLWANECEGMCGV